MRPHPNVFVGDKFTNKVGSQCEVIEYVSNTRVKIKFLDCGGFEKYSNVQLLKTGSFSNPNVHSGKGKKVSVFVGQIFETNGGGVCKVIEYRNSKNILVEFCDDWEYRVYCSAQYLKKGQVKNVYAKSVCGVGYLGEGKHTCGINGETSPAYRAWSDMFSRCYRNPKDSYIACTVHLDWHSFQVFAEWYYNQKGWDKNFDLDKDLIIKGNKVYSKDTCSLVPREINLSIINSRACRGDLPIGVSKQSDGLKYSARVYKGGKPIWLGSFSSVGEAFLEFKTHKEGYLKYLAEKWKESVDLKVYSALNNYLIEIDD